MMDGYYHWMGGMHWGWLFGVEQMRTGIALAGLRPLPAAALRVLRWLRPERRPTVRSLLHAPVRWLHRRAYRSAEARRLGTAALVAAELAAGGDRRRASFAVPDGALATAWLPVLLAERGSELPGGVATPMDLFDLDAVLAWLRAHGDAFDLNHEDPTQEAP